MNRKTEDRAVIKYLHLKGMVASGINDYMLRTLTEIAPSYSYATVTWWIKEFEQGRDSVDDDQGHHDPEQQLRITLTLIMSLNIAETWDEPSHMSTVAMATIHHCGFKLVPYSPDLVCSNYLYPFWFF